MHRLILKIAYKALTILPCYWKAKTLIIYRKIYNISLQASQDTFTKNFRRKLTTREHHREQILKKFLLLLADPLVSTQSSPGTHLLIRHKPRKFSSFETPYVSYNTLNCFHLTIILKISSQKLIVIERHHLRYTETLDTDQEA